MRDCSHAYEIGKVCKRNSIDGLRKEAVKDHRPDDVDAEIYDKRDQRAVILDLFFLPVYVEQVVNEYNAEYDDADNVRFCVVLQVIRQSAFSFLSARQDFGGQAISLLFSCSNNQDDSPVPCSFRHVSGPAHLAVTKNQMGLLGYFPHKNYIISA